MAELVYAADLKSAPERDESSSLSRGIYRGASSSVGQSIRLISERSQVRVLPGPQKSIRASRAVSSVGQSASFTPKMSGVRVPHRPQTLLGF